MIRRKKPQPPIARVEGTRGWVMQDSGETLLSLCGQMASNQLLVVPIAGKPSGAGVVGGGLPFALCEVPQ